jgi:hypothetical protein
MHLQIRNYLVLIVLSVGFLFYACSDSGTGTDPDPDPDPNPNPDPTEEFDSRVAPGDSAASFLQGDQYASLQIEIDYMEGYEPTEQGLNSLTAFLESRLNKDNISYTTTQIAARGEAPYTSENIVAIEEEERDNYTEGGSNTLHVYFLILDGEFEQSNVLGVAYYNTSMALFGQTIEEISGSLTGPSRAQIEGTVLRHEMGHNMGLVGNGSPHPEGQTSHQTDASQGAHCTTDGCLMIPAVRTGDIFQNFSGEVPDLGTLCIEDLQANGGR